MAGPCFPPFLQNHWNFAVPSGGKQSQHSEFSPGHSKIPNFWYTKKLLFFPQKPRERPGMHKQRGLGAGKNIPRVQDRPKFQVWNENCSLGGSGGSQGDTGAGLGWKSLETFLSHPFPGGFGIPGAKNRGFQASFLAWNEGIALECREGSRGEWGWGQNSQGDTEFPKGVL